MQSSAANEHLQLCNITVAHLCLLNSSHPPTGPQTAADSLPVLGSERGLCRVIHAVNQGLGVSRVPTDTYDQLLSVKHLGATSKWSLDSNLKAHLLLPSEGFCATMSTGFIRPWVCRSLQTAAESTPALAV